MKSVRISVDLITKVRGTVTVTVRLKVRVEVIYMPVMHAPLACPMGRHAYQLV